MPDTTHGFNANNIIASLNPTLNYLRVNKLDDQFTVVSSTPGEGDYTSIVTALNAGHEYIFVKRGTYVETADLVLDGQTLIGEGPECTIIQLVNQSVEIKTKVAATAYRTGTITLTNNSVAITGAGTAWATGATAPSTYAEPWLVTRGAMMPINSVVNDTTINLKQQYRGPTLAAQEYYVIDLENMGAVFTGFRVEHSPTVGTACMKISGLSNIIENNVLDCDRVNTSNVIWMAPINTSMACNCRIAHNTLLSGQIGMELLNCSNATIEENQFISQADHAIRTETGTQMAWGNRITKNKFFGTTNAVIELEANSHETIITENDFTLCSGAWCINIDASDYVIVSKNRAEETGANFIASTNVCEKMVIEGNSGEGNFILDIAESTIKGNCLSGDGSIEILNGNGVVIEGNSLEEGRINVSGTSLGTVIANNTIVTESAGETDKIYCLGGESTITGNVIRDSGGYGIQAVGNNCTINDNTVLSALSDGIYVTGNFNVIAGNMVEDSSARGIHVNGGDYAVVNSNVTDNCALAGIRLNGSARGTVTGNTLRNSDRGVDLANSDAVSVIGNTISDFDVYGIVADGNCDNGTINGNTITNGNTATGIWYGGGGDCTINGNNIYFTGGNGIEFDTSGNACEGIAVVGNRIQLVTVGITGQSDGELHIDGNVIGSCSGNGMTITGGQGDFKTISNNHIFETNGTAGILINDDSEHTNINGNNLQNTAGHGIHLTTGAEGHGTMNGNVIEDATGHGIYLEAEGGVSIVNTDYTVEGNNIYSATQNGIECGSNRCLIIGNRCDHCANGIALTICDQCIVSGNGCDSNTTDGIVVAATSDRIIITGNICLNNGGVQINNAGTNTVVGNNIAV